MTADSHEKVNLLACVIARERHFSMRIRSNVYIIISAVVVVVVAAAIK